MLGQEIINLFPTPIMTTDIDVVLEEEDINAFKNLEMVRYPIDNGSHSKDLNVIEPKQFSLLRSSILNHFYDYLDYLSVSKFDYDWFISSSWVNLHKPGDYSHRHFHTNSIISAIYYLDIPENSGNTIFELDEQDNRLHMPTVKLKFFEPNMYNSERVELKAITGNCVFFPSRLRHSVTKNKSDQNRYSIAMNFFFKGDTSDGQNRLELK